MKIRLILLVEEWRIEGPNRGGVGGSYDNTQFWVNAVCSDPVIYCVKRHSVFNICGSEHHAL